MNTKRFVLRFLRGMLTLVVGLLLSLVGLAAERPEALLTTANPRVLEVIDVQEAATPSLMAVEGILGTAVGLDADGQVTLIVYVNVEGRDFGQAMRSLPKAIGKVRVVAEPTDPFRALVKPGGCGGGVSHQVETQGVSSMSAGSVSFSFRDDVRAKVLPDAVRNMIPRWWGTPRSGNLVVPVARS